jgi:membrane-associated protease RseP (regulator of RpoE activity)
VCTDCGIEIVTSQAAPVWSFSSPPVIEHVEHDGPAERAGLRAGDSITHIDDVQLTSAEGGIAFGAVEPGQTVTLRYARSGAVRTARLRAAERATVLAPARPTGVPAPGQSPDPPAPPEILRFAGRVGDALIRVTGGPVSVSETETEVVIRSRDVTVRVSKRDDPDSD